MSDDDLTRRGDALALVAGHLHRHAIAALPAVTVLVKPLVWEPSVIDKPWHSAKAPWGWYYAQWDDETQAYFASLEMGEIEAPIILSPSDVPTLEAAKAAAQADYEARILAALEPVTPAPHVNETPKTEHDAGNVLTPAPDAAAIRIADEVFDRLEAKGATTAAFGAAEVGEALREAGAQSDAAAIREAALMTVPDEIELYYIIKASGAKKRIDVARAVSAHLEPMRRAILALITEKPHDRA